MSYEKNLIETLAMKNEENARRFCFIFFSQGGEDLLICNKGFWFFNSYIYPWVQLEAWQNGKETFA